MHLGIHFVIVAFRLINNIEPVLASTALRISDFKGCSSTEFRLQTFFGISIKRCAEKCKSRPDCSLLNYHTSRKMCELLQRVGDKTIITQSRPCVKVLRSDIDKSLTCDAADVDCTDVACPVVNVTNADVKGNMQNVGAKAKVTCKPGYTMTTGSKTITCDQTGSWTNVSTCQAECPPPPVTPPNAAWIANVQPKIEPIVQGVIAMYVCIPNTVRIPEAADMTITCQVDGTWSDFKFECKTGCPPPPATLTAAILMDMLPITDPPMEGATATYVCDPNSVTVPAAADMTIACQANGTWSDFKFECKTDCGEPSKYENATLQDGETLESASRTYMCNSGYITKSGKDNFIVTCQSNGIWTTPAITCAEVQTECPPPPVYSTPAIVMHITTVPHWPGAVVIYGCVSNSVSVPEAADMTITCQSDGMWSDFKFECKRDCGEPLDYENATVQDGGTLESTNRTYKCNAFYITTLGTDNFTVTCQNDGKWSTPAVTCVGDCFGPRHMRYARKSYVNTFDGSTVKYTCNNDFVIEYKGSRNTTTHTVTCDGRNWVDMDFKCVPECPASTSDYTPEGSQQLAFCATLTTNEEAKQACSRYGALVKIDTPEKQFNIIAYVQGSPSSKYHTLWIQGGLDPDDNTWKFDNGKEIEHFFWKTNKSSEEGENCITFTNGEWDDYHCSWINYFICEMIAVT